MASVLHSSARTTPRIRAELKAAKAPARALASHCGLNVKTVLKWRNRVETTDAPMGPKAKSWVLTLAEEAPSQATNIRSRLLRAWHRAPVDQPLSSLDQRASRANEPNCQGSTVKPSTMKTSKVSRFICSASSPPTTSPNISKR